MDSVPSCEFVPEFDLDGNQTMLRTTTGIWHVTYNAENRPVIFSNETAVIEMGYDYMGRRFEYKETGGGAVTRHERHLYRGYLRLAALDLLGETNVLHAIAWDPSEPVATRPLALQTQSGWFAFSFDLVKNVTELFDASGNIAAAYDYAPFGAVAESAGPAVSINPLTFSSEISDTTLGLQYYNYRHLNTLDGVWAGRDLIGEIGGINLYVLAGNNPVVFIDIMGMSFWDYWPLISWLRLLIQGAEGQDKNDYPGYVSRRLCCEMGVMSAEAKCLKDNQNAYLGFVKQLGVDTLKSKMMDAVIAFVGLPVPYVSIAALVDAVIGTGVSIQVGTEMHKAYKQADEENCACSLYNVY